MRDGTSHAIFVLFCETDLFLTPTCCQNAYNYETLSSASEFVMNGPWWNRDANINPHKTWCGLRQSPCITVWVSGPWFPVVGPYGGLLIVSEMEKKECHPGLGGFISPLTSPPQAWLTPTGCFFFKPTAGLVCILNAHKRAKQDYCCWSGNEGLSRSWRGKLRCSVLWLSGRWDGCRGSGPFSCMLEEGTLVVFFFCLFSGKGGLLERVDEKPNWRFMRSGQSEDEHETFMKPVWILRSAEPSYTEQKRKTREIEFPTAATLQFWPGDAPHRPTTVSQKTSPHQYVPVPPTGCSSSLRVAAVGAHL